jgi:hypothetical protein
VYFLAHLVVEETEIAIRLRYIGSSPVRAVIIIGDIMKNKIKKGEYYLYYPTWPDNKHWIKIVKLIGIKGELKLKDVYKKVDNKLIAVTKPSFLTLSLYYNSLIPRREYQRIKKNKLQELLVQEMI